jgi:putative phage-type endonuclease
MNYTFSDDFRRVVPDIEQRMNHLLQSMAVTRADVIQVMNIPQRTPEWKQWRGQRLTASVFGSAAGHNPYQSPQQLLKTLLWEDFQGNPATQHGTLNEPVAADVYERYMCRTTDSVFRFLYPGLIICESQPWIGVSADGIVEQTHRISRKKTRFLLEIKCPYYKKSYDYIPHYYYDQIQGVMAVLGLPFCDFVVWNKEETQIRRFKFEKTYWENELYPALRDFYMNQYLPRLILKQLNKLEKGQIFPLTPMIRLPSITLNCSTPTTTTSATETVQPYVEPTLPPVENSVWDRLLGVTTNK